MPMELFLYILLGFIFVPRIYFLYFLMWKPIKLEASLENGETLILIPCWWDGSADRSPPSPHFFPFSLPFFSSNILFIVWQQQLSSINLIC